MKKIFLFFFLLCGLIQGKSQNIIITSNESGGVVPANLTLTYWVADSNGTFQTIDVRYFTVNVNYTTPSRLLVRKYETGLASPAAEIYFCTDITCYPNWIFLSDTLELTPGGSFDLSVDYKTGYSTGTSSVSYTIFNVDNPSDSIQFNVVYNVVSGPVTVNENQRPVSSTLSAPMPNPASGNFALQYNTGNTAGAVLNIYNAIGELVSSATLSNTQGICVTDTTELPEGIYICTLVSEGIITGTQRIIVVH
jgi:hypothetical protein